MSDTQAPLPADEAEDEANSIEAASTESTGPVEEPAVEADSAALAESQAEIEGESPSEEDIATEAALTDAEPDIEEEAQDETSDAESEAQGQPLSEEETAAEAAIADAGSDIEEEAQDETSDAESESQGASPPEEEPGTEAAIVDAAPDAEEEAEEETSDAEPEAAEKPEEIDDGREWFVVHSYSGYENKVKNNLEHRIESMNMQDKIFQVVVPTEEEIEIREGNRRRTKKRVFPGYILVQMLMDEESWYVVRNTPGVTGFVGSGTKPTPLRKQEVDKIFSRMEAEAPKIKVSFREGQTVRITDGPFADFVGVVEDMNLDKGKVTVMVSFFGRETPVELDFLQVQKQ